MKTEANNNSKLTFRILKTGLLLALVSTVVYFGLLYVFGVKYLKEDYYGSYFYAWRLRYADKIMTHGRYKYIKKNEHPEEDDRKDFYKIAQDEDGKAYLTRFDRPEHYPREFDYQFTLLKLIPTYKDFLEIRQNYIVETEGLQDKLKLSGEDLKKEVKDRKENEHRFFTDAPEKSVDDMVKILFPSDNVDKNPWSGVCPILMSTISSILGNDKDYFFDGKEASPKLVDAINKGLKALDVKELSSDKIHKFFINNGRVSASPVETFIYSRLYYVFYFLTSGMEFEADFLSDLKKSASDEKGKQKFYEGRMMYVANMFARIFSSLYPNKNNKDVSNIKYGEKFRNYYSPHRTVESDPIKESDLDLIKKNFDEYLKANA